MRTKIILSYKFTINVTINDRIIQSSNWAVQLELFKFINSKAYFFNDGQYGLDFIDTQNTTFFMTSSFSDFTVVKFIKQKSTIGYTMDVHQFFFQVLVSEYLTLNSRTVFS